MATARKPLQPATEPVIPPDEAWANELEAKRDASLIEEQAKRNDLVAREGYYEREEQRLAEAKAKEVGALKQQIDRQIAIQASCQAALSALKDIGSNVVPMKPKADEAPIPEFLRREISPVAKAG